MKGTIQILLLFTLYICLLQTQPVFALTPSKDPYLLLRHIPEKKQACHKASKIYWAGSTADMMTGSDKYNACLENIATEMANTYYPSNVFAPEGFKQQLQKIDKQLDSLYWPIYNDLKSCPPNMGCGSLFHTSPGEAVSRYLEQFIIDMATQVDIQRSDRFEKGDIVNEDWMKRMKSNQ